VSTAISIERDVPLAARTTLELGGAARFFVRACDEATARDALEFARARGLPVAVLGGGSNVVLSDAGFEGLVIAMAQRGVSIAVQGATAELTVQAGEPWDDVVAMAVERDLSGLECLSGIPGLTGATPIQNVGAYGQEVARAICGVRVLDRESLQVHEIEPAQCGFGYRTSAFKRAPERCVVLAVRFALHLGGDPCLAYPELRRALGVRDGGALPELAKVREAVLALRRSKSMVLDSGDDNRRSAGSFFLNPVVTATAAQQLVELALARGWVKDAEEVPRYPAEGDKVKLAAAWLIERAGFVKGERRGAFGISSRHSLALVHHGGGRSAELVSFAREVRDRVRAQTGVTLEPEPVFVGFGAGFEF
jgi:UDP-N-acetylmuramate dehydrogenase